MKRFLCRQGWWIGLLLLVVACEVVTPPQGDFSLRSDNVLNSLSPGGQVSVPIRIDRMGGFDGEVVLELTGAPAGVRGRFDPASTRGNRSTLTVTAEESAIPGQYTLSVVGTSGGLSRSLSLSVMVVGDGGYPNFNLGVVPASLALQPGQSGVVDVVVNRSGGFSDAVTLSVSDTPSGVSTSFGSSHVADQTTFTVSVGAGVAPGSYSLVIEGEATGLTRQVILGLSVQGAGGNVRLSGKVRTANAEIPLPASGALDLDMLMATADAPSRARYVPGQLLVQYHEPSGQLSTQRALEHHQEARRLTAQAHGLRVLRAAPPGQPDLVELARGDDVEAAAARVQRDPRVRYAEPNYYLYPVGLPNDPRLMDQWALAAAGVPVAWEREHGSSNRVVVAVIDSGVALNHEDLQGQLLPGHDFCANTNCTATDDDPGPGNTNNFHGTHVAGIIGAAGGNHRGIAGVSYGERVRLLPVKVFNDNGGGATVQALADGIRWSVGMNVGDGVSVNRNPAKIINLSLGGYFTSALLQNAIDDARARGALVIAAAGNNGIDELMVPAALDGVLSVGSINPALVRSCFSNYGASQFGPGVLDIVAPGGDGSANTSPFADKPTPSCNPPSRALISTIPGNTYGNSAGTSMATPMVAGVAALIWSENPGLSANQVRARILSSAYFDPSYMTPQEYGAGILRADRALGLPGPGDQLRVVALGPEGERSAQVTLDTKGGSSTYRLEGLTSGDHQITVGSVGSLYGGLELTLSGSPAQSAPEIRAGYVP